jgi:hypothetical protein
LNPLQANQNIRLKKETASINVTYTNYDESLIDVSIFAVPTTSCKHCEPVSTARVYCHCAIAYVARPSRRASHSTFTFLQEELGFCKQCGVDFECPMQECMS